jgi:cbb3-type cytochrome oxidase cytochrome c subunit
MKKFLIPSIICLFLILTAARPSLPLKEKTPQKAALDSLSLITPLEMYGAYIFEREKCGDCHSRSAYYAFVSLRKVKGKYSNAWHYKHLESPVEISAYSNMPSFPHLLKQEIDAEQMKKLLVEANAELNSKYYGDNAAEMAAAQASEMAKGMEKENIKDTALAQKEVIALIAYLQKMTFE